MVAMMACFGSVSARRRHMVAEMTGSFSVVPGAIIAVGYRGALLSAPTSPSRDAALNRQTASCWRR